MAPTERTVLEQLFQELSAPIGSPIGSITFGTAVMFGRNDLRLIDRLTRIDAWDGTQLVITGGVGKDSGDLPKHGHTEASWLAMQIARGLPMWPVANIWLDQAARNGGENARNAVQIIQEQELPCDDVLLLIHATSLQRLHYTFDLAAVQAGLKIGNLSAAPTRYPFNPQSAGDREEVLGELLRLLLLPHKGFGQRTPRLDDPAFQELAKQGVDLARRWYIQPAMVGELDGIGDWSAAA